MRIHFSVWFLNSAYVTLRAGFCSGQTIVSRYVESASRSCALCAIYHLINSTETTVTRKCEELRREFCPRLETHERIRNMLTWSKEKRKKKKKKKRKERKKEFVYQERTFASFILNIRTAPYFVGKRMPLIGCFRLSGLRRNQPHKSSGKKITGTHQT